MDKQGLISHAERTIEYYQSKIKTLNAIEPGYVFEFKNGVRSYLARLSTFNSESVRLELFACSDMQWHLNKNCSNSFNYSSIQDIKRILKNDLALYAGWDWKSPEFEKILKGTSRLRLKFVS